MDVAVLTSDLVFFSAVEGVAGAMGHRAHQFEAIGDVPGAYPLVIADLGSLDVTPEALRTLDPLRVVAFAPHVRADLFTGARAHGIDIYRRGALATELPRVLSERA